MTGRRSVVRAAMAGVLITGVAVSPGAAADKSKEGVVARGGYVGAACVPTALTPEGAFTCRGESTYTGYFTTVNPFVVVGTVRVDTATGQATARGYVDESHFGRAADGSVGSIRTFQTFEQYADGTGAFTGCVLEGTGDWANASGTLTAEGWQGVAAVGALGSYRFRWNRTGDPKARAECARRMNLAKAQRPGG